MTADTNANQPEATIQRPLILIIEDDPTIRQFVRLTLTSADYDVLESASGQGGLALAVARRPDLILLDLGLPDTNGFEVTRQLRQWTLAPILVLSGKQGESDKVAALDAGADDFIAKPYGVEELLARVRSALRRWWLSPQSGENPIYADS